MTPKRSKNRALSWFSNEDGLRTKSSGLSPLNFELFKLAVLHSRWERDAHCLNCRHESNQKQCTWKRSNQAGHPPGPRELRLKQISLVAETKFTVPHRASIGSLLSWAKHATTNQTACGMPNVAGFCKGFLQKGIDTQGTFDPQNSGHQRWKAN